VKVNFILPFYPRVPGGGCKIMYQYANKLSEKGYDVAIYHAIQTEHGAYKHPYWLRYLRYLPIMNNAKPKWFKLGSKIDSKIIPSVQDEHIRDADIIISTWWATAVEVSRLSTSKGKKYNLIQDYEIWFGNEDLVQESYKLPNTTNIVIAKYLQEKVEFFSGVKPIYIPNAIDQDKFGVDIEIENKNNDTIAMMYSEAPWKGSKYGLEALSIVHEKYPSLKVNLFSVYPQPQNLPSYITYFENSKHLRDIYNKSVIFFTPSLQEGWGLPSMEAMSCGCALVCTNIDGHADYAKNNETALHVEPRNPEDMAEKLLLLLNDKTKRTLIAHQGNEYIKKFTWESSVYQLEKAFEN